MFKSITIIILLVCICLILSFVSYIEGIGNEEILYK